MLLRYFHEGSNTIDLTGTWKTVVMFQFLESDTFFVLIYFRMGPDNIDNNPVKTTLFVSSIKDLGQGYCG